MNSERESVLVTGGSRGLGRGVCLELARRGYSVGINYVSNREAAEETAELCAEAATESEAPRGGADIGEAAQFVPLQANVRLREDRERLVEAAFGRFGSLRALVNNAGIAPRERNDIVEATEDSFSEVLETNLQGPHFLTQAVVRRWLDEDASKRGQKQILFVSSISADTVSINRGEYCISKAGLAMSSLLWATRLAGEGILSLEIRPGIMKTDMTAGVRDKYDTLIGEGLVPQRRWGTPEDIGRAVAAVVGGDFAFSPGSVIYADGGFHISRL